MSTSHDTKLEGAVDTLKDKEALQRELDKLEGLEIVKHLVAFF